MENQQISQEDTTETQIQLTLTLGQVNGILQVLSQGPYQTVKPLIEEITTQARNYVAKLNPARPVPASQAQTTTPQHQPLPPI